MRWEIKPAVVSNDKTANKERETMRSSEKEGGLLHTELIWLNHHGVAVTYTAYTFRFHLCSDYKLWCHGVTNTHMLMVNMWRCDSTKSNCNVAAISNSE
jgi:hypothetical protein